MVLTDKQRIQIGKMLDVMYEERPSQTDGVRFAMQESKRIVVCMFEAYNNGITDFQTAFYKYYSLGGVRKETAYKYWQEFCRKSEFAILDGYTFRIIVGPKIIEAKALEWDKKHPALPEEAKEEVKD